MRALLVDLDGTLVDTAAANFAAYSAALGEVGVTITSQAFESFAHGRNWREFLPPMLESSTVAPEAISARKATLYPRFLHLTGLNEDVRRLIELVRPGWGTALVTTASRVSADAVLAHHGISELFDQIVSGDDVLRHKPDPEAYRLAAARLGVEPQACVVIEDSEAGTASGRAFGAATIRVRFP